MAELQVEGDELVLRLSRIEKLEAMHGDLRAPRSAVRSIEVLEDAHEPADHGLKMGERLPGYSEVAIVRTRGRKVFAVVHPDTPRGVQINVEGIGYDAWIVGSADPESLKRRIGQS
jgi:plasmid stabilization system protein ParE